MNVSFPPGKLFINGEFVDALDGQTFQTINPAREEPLLDIARAGKNDVNRAVESAYKAFTDGPWATMKPHERARFLWKIAEKIWENRETFALLEALDAGKPYRDNLNVDVPMVVELFEYYAGWVTKLTGETLPTKWPAFVYTLREPLGVCGAITPWNFPLLLAVWKIAPALACGNTVVLKPSEHTPLTALKLAEIFQQVDAPPGIFNVIPGPGNLTGRALVRHPLVHKIAFTGSTEVGKLIMKESADTLKRVTLELGGKSPNIILADADISNAVKGAFIGIFYNQGEVCAAGSRLIVEKSIHDKVVEGLIERAQKLKPGDPAHPKTRMGPLANREQFEKVLRYIEIGKQEGGTLVYGGETPDNLKKGYYILPTLFDNVQADHTIAREEIFGPVLSIITVENMDEALEVANQTLYGLASAVWTRDIQKAHLFAQKLQAGTVWINTYNLYDTTIPFGGYKYSGFGRELGKHALDMYTQVKSVWVSLL